MMVGCQRDVSFPFAFGSVGEAQSKEQRTGTYTMEWTIAIKISCSSMTKNCSDVRGTLGT